MSNTVEGKLGPLGHVYLANTGNVMTADGERTDVMLSLGNTIGQSINGASPSFGQPSDTIITGNTLLSNGPCNATRGCTVRLLAGVTVNVDATSNEWGVTSNDQIREAIWDKFRDGALGQVITYCAAGTYAITTLDCAAPTRAAAAPTAQPSGPLFATPPPPAPPTPIASSTPTPVGSALSTPVPPPNFPAAAAAPAPGVTPPPPMAYIDPATDSCYVEVTVCVTNANNQPVANDPLVLSLSDATGAELGVVLVTTASNGCFNGEVAAQGGAAQLLPAAIAVSDPSGAVTDLGVGTGSPLYRPPVTPVATNGRASG